jgi:hypothetical protein
VSAPVGAPPGGDDGDGGRRRQAPPLRLAFPTAGSTPTDAPAPGPASTAEDWLATDNRAHVVAADDAANVRRIAERDQSHVVDAFAARCAELDADAATWRAVCALPLAVVGLFYGVRQGFVQTRRDGERYERERDRAVERHDRAVERWERDRAERYDREHRAALAMADRRGRESEERGRLDLSVHYAPTLARWDAPEAPRPPREPDPPDMILTVAWWALACSALGVGLGAGAVVEQFVGPRRGLVEAELSRVVEDRLRARLGLLAGGEVPVWRVDGWRASWRELARADCTGNAAGARLIGAAAREIPGGRIVAALLGEGDDEKKKR